jgi:hypothetical protein
LRGVLWKTRVQLGGYAIEQKKVAGLSKQTAYERRGVTRCLDNPAGGRLFPGGGRVPRADFSLEVHVDKETIKNFIHWFDQAGDEELERHRQYILAKMKLVSTSEGRAECRLTRRLLDKEVLCASSPDIVRLVRQRAALLAALNLIEVDKDGDGFICREAMDQVRQAIALATEVAEQAVRTPAA